MEKVDAICKLFCAYDVINNSYSRRSTYIDGLKTVLDTPKYPLCDVGVCIKLNILRDRRKEITVDKHAAATNSQFS